jgi:hypothetical protein
MNAVTDPQHHGTVDLYEVLEVSPRASHDVIQAAYRVLALNAHPDRNAASDAEQRIRQINAAYQILGDPGLRAKYDLECARARRSERPVPPRNGAASSVVLRRDLERTRVLAARSAVQQSRPERLGVINMQVVILFIFAMLAVGALLVTLAWLNADAVMSDDTVSVSSVPLQTRAIMQLQPYEAQGR